jgi:hypothetical protein
MRLTKIIFTAIAIIFVAVQFIRPSQNKNEQVLATDISKVVNIPDSVRIILQNACYDCHSNNTNYPWYSKIQPVGWYLAKHIAQARDDLNFSEFGGYSPRVQLSKLDEITNAIRDNIMPLPSYKMMHKNAQLSTYEKAQLIGWAQHSEESLPVSK